MAVLEIVVRKVDTNKANVLIQESDSYQGSKVNVILNLQHVNRKDAIEAIHATLKASLL